MIQTQDIILKIHVINFPFYKFLIIQQLNIEQGQSGSFSRNQIGLLFHFETRNHSIFLALIYFFIGCTSPRHLLSIIAIFFSLVFIRCNSLYRWLSIFVQLIVVRCQSISFVVTRCTSRCHLLYNSLLFIVTCCHSLSLVVPLVVPLVCLFINDLLKM